MTERMTAKEFLAMKSKPKKSKYKNVKTVVDGLKFDSTAEAEYYVMLKILRDKTQEVTHFFRQVPFDCGAGIKYRLDFLVFYGSGKVEYVDVKGVRTDVFEIKRKLVESLYPITIKCVWFKNGLFVEKLE